MGGVVDKLYAYIYLRGFKIWSSYRTQMILNVLSWILPVFTYYFVGTSLGSSLVKETGIPNNNYTAFIVVGLAFQGYVSSTITTISQRLRNEQVYGTIEYYVLSSGGVLSFLIYSILWGFIINTVNALVTLSIGLALKVNYDINIISTSIIVFLLLLSTIGFAMISAGFTMIIKQGNPIAFFFSTFTTLMSGTVFPATILPIPLKIVSFGLPLTWALEGLRLSMLSGEGVAQLTNVILVLIIFNLILLPIGVSFYSYSFKRARKKGTLSEY